MLYSNALHNFVLFLLHCCMSGIASRTCVVIAAVKFVVGISFSTEAIDHVAQNGFLAAIARMLYVNVVFFASNKSTFAVQEVNYLLLQPHSR